MAADEQRRVTLPAAVLKSAQAITSVQTMSPSDRLTGVLLLIYGWAWYDQQDQVDPRNIALPNGEWLQICEYLTTGNPDDRLTGVNLGLSFMNQGPSSYAN